MDQGSTKRLAYNGWSDLETMSNQMRKREREHTERMRKRAMCHVPKKKEDDMPCQSLAVDVRQRMTAATHTTSLEDALTETAHSASVCLSLFLILSAPRALLPFLSVGLRDRSRKSPSHSHALPCPAKTAQASRCSQGTVDVHNPCLQVISWHRTSHTCI